MKFKVLYRTGDSRIKFVYVTYLILESSIGHLLSTEGELIQYERKERI